MRFAQECIVVFCLGTCGLITSEALPINPHEARSRWPAQTSNPYEAWAKWHATSQGILDTNASRGWGRNPKECSAQLPKPAPNDGIKSVALPLLLDQSKWRVVYKKPGSKWDVEATSHVGFPELFTVGIGISAGPPPQSPKDDYQTWNKEAWAQKYGTDAAGADSDLSKYLTNYQLYHTNVNAIIEVDGVYEGCQERSHIIDLNMDQQEIYAFGEELRAQFFQDTYLYFGPLQGINSNVRETKCGAMSDWDDDDDDYVNAPKVPYFRAIGLGFGEGGNGGTQYVRLGNLCTFDKPDNVNAYPKACSMSVMGNDMWAGTDVPFGTGNC